MRVMNLDALFDLCKIDSEIEKYWTIYEALVPKGLMKLFETKAEKRNRAEVLGYLYELEVMRCEAYNKAWGLSM